MTISEYLAQYGPKPLDTSTLQILDEYKNAINYGRHNADFETLRKLDAFTSALADVILYGLEHIRGYHERQHPNGQ